MTSLEELLADDGFKKGRLRQGPGRNLKPVSMPLYAATNHNPLYRHNKNPSKLSRRSHSSVTEAVRHPPDPTLLFRPASVIKIDGFDERERDDESGDGFSDKVQEKNTRHDRGDDRNPAPGIDQAATRAIVSILAGYIRMFFKDDNLRASLRHSCLSWLQSCRKEGEDGHEDDEPVANLENAIEAVERGVEGALDSKDMKRASLKLSLMAKLSSEESKKNEYTSGIPNSYLSACSHLYLSFINKLQRKDKVSATHLLQVFCDSPNQARTELLPAIWSHLFFPHLCHLKVWYDKETEAIARSLERKKRLQVLDTLYSTALDEGTYKFATYYKEWLVQEKEGPDLPIIDVPAESFPNYPEEASPVLSDPVPSQPIVSKRLYDNVFSHLNKITVIEEAEEEEEEDDDDNEGGAVEKHDTVVESTPQELENKDKNSGEHIKVVKQDRHAPSNGSHEHKSSSQNIPEEKELIIECEDVRSYPLTKPPNPVPQVKDHELALKKLAQAVFQHHSNDVDDFTMPYPQQHPEHDLHQRNQTKFKETKNGVKKNAVASTTNSGAEPVGCYAGIDKGSFFSSIPKEFMCPLTGHLFKDPVTLESGQTFERTAIEEWFKQGGKTCPITSRELESVSVPATNFVLKRLINGWKSEHCRNLLVFATQIAGNVVKDHKSKDEAALFIIEQLLTGFDTGERKENARYLISLGGMHFLTRRLELGNLHEKIRVVSLLLSCIEAEGSCRSFLAMNIRGPWILELLHSKKTNTRANAVKLMIELICLNRRLAIRSFLNGLHTQAIVNTMHILLVYLQTSLPSERALVAILLLHLDLMVEPRRYSIYREEAVDGIIAALECSMFDGKLAENSRRALLMLWGHFSASGEILTEDCLLKQAGCYTNPINVSVDYDGEIDEIISKDEEKEREEWSNNVALVLLSNGKRSLLDTLARCLASKSAGIVRVCLVVVAWLSHALPSLSAAGFELSEFINLVPLLKECMKNDSNMDNRVFASISLLNLSKISECRVLLISFAKEMIIPLENLMEVTWTAEQLYTAIFGED